MPVKSCLRPCTGTLGTVPIEMRTPGYKNANLSERRVPEETLQDSLLGVKKNPACREMFSQLREHTEVAATVA